MTKNDVPSAPEQINTKMVSTAEATTDEVDRILRLLAKRYKQNRKQPLDFFKFVINPQSFSLSVENIFHLSFLVRDTWAKITNVDGKLFIEPIGNSDKNDPKSNNNKQAGKDLNHMVFNITYEVWANLIQGLGLEGTEPMIPEKKSSSSS